jgi:hypothetical protein
MSVKLFWQRSRPIFSAVLIVLLVLGCFWLIGPTFVSNFGFIIDRIAGSPNLKPWIEGVEKNYQFFVFLFSLFVIGMGFARWLGKWQWYEGVVSRRKTLNLPVALLFDTDPSSFSYTTLFQGGLIGLIGGWYFLSQLFSMPPSQDLLENIPRTMSNPIVLLGLASIQFFLMNVCSRQGFDTLVHSPYLIIASTFLLVIAGTSVVVVFILLFKENTDVLLVEVILAVVLCFCFSYTWGVKEGVTTADPEKAKYLLVSIELIQGTSFDNAWLYERTDSDYRIVLKDGSNHIIPASNVKQIKGL